MNTRPSNKPQLELKDDEIQPNTPSFSRELLEEHYAGIELHYDNFRFVFSIQELIEIIFDKIKYYHECKNDLLSQDLKENLGKKDIILGGGIHHWLSIAENMQQKKWNQDEKEIECGFMLAGRRLTIKTPADRYVFDQGSENQYAKEIKASDNSQNNTSRLDDTYGGETLSTYQNYSHFKASDAFTTNNVNIGYRMMARDFLTNQLSSCSDQNITHGIRQALSGMAPLRDETILDINSEIKKIAQNTKQIIADCDANIITPEQARESITEQYKFVPQPKDRQAFASDALTEMPSSLPTLVGAWFISEFSRNRTMFTVGKMLLDLIEIEANLTCNNMPINWRTVLCHPDMSLEGTLSKIDPNRILMNIGGLYPMSHLGSFDNEFKKGPFFIDPLNLGLAHIKSGAIICEWLSHYFINTTVNYKILSKQEFNGALKFTNFEKNKFPLDDPEEIIEALQKKIVYSEDPEQREKWFLLWEKSQHVLIPNSLFNSEYQNKRKQAKDFLAKTFDRLHHKSHCSQLRHYNPTPIARETHEFKMNTSLDPIKITIPTKSEMYCNKEKAIAHHLATLNPNDPDKDFKAGKDYLSLGKHDNALTCFENNLKKFPKHIETFIYIGTILEIKKKYNLALKNYNDGLAINPQHIGLLISKASILAKLTKIEESISCFKLAQSLKPDDVSLTYNFAVVLYENRQYADAFTLIEQSLTSLPKDSTDITERLITKSLILYQLKKPKEALTCLEQVLQTCPQNWENLLYAGFESKLQAYQKAFFNYGYMLHELKLYTEALIALQSALEINPDDQEAETTISTILETQYQNSLQKNLELAEDYYKKQNLFWVIQHTRQALLIADRSNYPSLTKANLQYNLACYYYSLSKYRNISVLQLERAGNLFAESIKSAPRIGNLTHYANYLLNENETLEAIHRLRFILTSASPQEMIQNLNFSSMTQTVLDSHLINEVRYWNTLNIEAGIFARYLLIKAYHKKNMKNDIQSQLQLFEQNINQSQNPLSFSVLGHAYSIVGNYDAALRSYNKALKLKPDYSLVQNQISHCQFKLYKNSLLCLPSSFFARYNKEENLLDIIENYVGLSPII